MRHDSVRVRRLRAKYRKRMWVVAVVFLLIGLALGLFLGYNLFGGDFEGFSLSPSVKQATPTPGIMPTATPEAKPTDAVEPEASADTAEGSTGENYTIDLPDPTATPEPTATPAPTVKAVVPFGDSYTFTTQINSDGSARVSNSEGAYETISFTVTMKQFMRPGDYADKYSNMYKLQGTEAGAGFEIILNDYTGSATIVPQNVITVGFESADGSTIERGYQLMDAEIAGNYNIAVTTNTPKTLYKRYLYSNSAEEMEYMTISIYNNGVVEKILFEVEGEEIVATPTPAIVYPTLKNGDKNDDVMLLQERLLELDFLEGTSDGHFGNKTEAAVRAAQEAFNMEVTGIADNAFQQKLFEGVN